MEIRQLEYFLAVIEHNGVNRAAEQLHVAQATLSQGIKQLERELQLELFHRTGRNLILNSAGRLLVEPARRILAELLAAKDVMRGALELSVGSIAIGTMPEMSSEAVAAWSGSFTKKYPDIRIDMTEYADEQELCHEIVHGRCEIGFTTFPVQEEGLHRIPLGIQRLMLVMPPGTSVSKDAPLQLSHLDGQPLAMSKTAHRENDIVAGTLADRSITPRIGAYVPSRQAQLALVLTGSASAFLPIRIAVLAKKLGAVVVETEPTIRTPYGIVHRPQSLNPAAESFIRQSQAALREWVALIERHQTAGLPLIEAALRADADLAARA